MYNTLIPEKFIIIFAEILTKKGDKNHKSRKKSHPPPREIEKIRRLRKSRKLAVQLEDEYYKNGKTPKSDKFTIIFTKISMEKVVDVCENEISYLMPSHHLFLISYTRGTLWEETGEERS